MHLFRWEAVIYQFILYIILWYGDLGSWIKMIKTEFDRPQNTVDLEIELGWEQHNHERKARTSIL